MKIQLSDHFTYQKLLRFTLPSIVMMIFTSVYGVVDGLFVSNYVGKTPFAAVNLIYPFVMMLSAAGFMFGTGGSALISKTMGEGDGQKARRTFSLIIYVSLALGGALAAAGILALRPVAALLGAEGALLENCVTYGRILLCAMPAFFLQFEFQSLFVTAGKPQLGLAITVAAGLTNIILDALLVGWYSLGLVGAALATAFSQCVGGLIPLVYFARPNSSLLRLTATAFDGAALLKTCTNGASELLSNISGSLVSMLYNGQLMRYAGEDGVAAYGVLMYVAFVFLAVYIGYAVGTAPVIGYHYGAENHTELRGLLRKSLVVVGVCSTAMFAAAEALAGPLSTLFVGYDPVLFSLTLRAFRLYSFSFLCSGAAIFCSSFFTALNNGLVSALISFLRTVVFQVAMVFLLPLVWKVDGIWLSAPAAELLAAGVSAVFLAVMRKRYRY